MVLNRLYYSIVIFGYLCCSVRQSITQELELLAYDQALTQLTSATYTQKPTSEYPKLTVDDIDRVLDISFHPQHNDIIAISYEKPQAIEIYRLDGDKWVFLHKITGFYLPNIKEHIPGKICWTPLGDAIIGFTKGDYSKSDSLVIAHTTDNWAHYSTNTVPLTEAAITNWGKILSIIMHGEQRTFFTFGPDNTLAFSGIFKKQGGVGENTLVICLTQYKHTHNTFTPIALAYIPANLSYIAGFTYPSPKNRNAPLIALVREFENYANNPLLVWDIVGNKKTSDNIRAYNIQKEFTLLSDHNVYDYIAGYSKTNTDLTLYKSISFLDGRPSSLYTWSTLAKGGLGLESISYMAWQNDTTLIITTDFGNPIWSLSIGESPTPKSVVTRSEHAYQHPVKIHTFSFNASRTHIAYIDSIEFSKHSEKSINIVKLP